MLIVVMWDRDELVEIDKGQGLRILWRFVAYQFKQFRS